MRLQKRLNRVVDGVEYNKWVLTLPPEDIDKLHWRAGQELDTIVRNNELVIKPHKE